MTNQTPMTKPEDEQMLRPNREFQTQQDTANCLFRSGIRISDFFRHLSFVIRILCYPHTSAWRSCFKRSSSREVLEGAVKKLMPRAWQYSRKRWMKFWTVC